MSSAAIRGQFVWHDLMTTDTSGAGAFYPRIADWKAQPWELDSSYTLLVGEAGPMGGMMALPQETPASSHWMLYIGTPDIAATVATARELGATVCKDVTQLPNGDSYAVLQDPQGAVFAVHAAGTPDDATPGESDFSWHELSTADLDAALSFYSQLFGWEAGAKHDMGEIGYYQLFVRDGRDIGGIYKTPPGIETPHWLSYLRVRDVDEAAEAAKAAGGRVVNGPMEVPGGDWIAQIIDPQGAAFAVHEVKAKARKPKAAVKAKPAAQAKAEVAAAPAASEPAAKPPKRVASKAAPAKKAAASVEPKPAKRASVKKTSATAAPKRTAAVAKAKPVKKAAKTSRSAAARRPAARKKAAAKASASRKRASARAAGAVKSKRSRKVKRAVKRASAARRRPARAKVVKRRSARRVVRAKRRR